MKTPVDHASQWIYKGVWAVLVGLFNVPKQPPSHLSDSAATLQTFHPAHGFLRLLRLQFWLILTFIDGLLLAAWVIVFFKVSHTLAYLISPVVLFVMVAPDIVAYVAIYLRYDTTWYVLSDRSMRLRRGVWIIREATITFENVQNVSIRQGPIQRIFGISNLVVETAGGGGERRAHGHHHAQPASMHAGLIEGIDNPAELRELIMQRVRASKSAGLGDEHHLPQNVLAGSTGWMPAHLEVLREIRHLVVALRGIN